MYTTENQMLSILAKRAILDENSRLYFKELICIKTYNRDCENRERIGLEKGRKYKLFVGKFFSSFLNRRAVFVFVPGGREFLISDDVFEDWDGKNDAFNVEIDKQEHQLIFIPKQGIKLVPEWWLNKSTIDQYLRTRLDKPTLFCMPEVNFYGSNPSIGWGVFDVIGGKVEKIHFFNFANGLCEAPKKVTVRMTIHSGTINLYDGRTEWSVFRDNDTVKFLC